MAGHHLDDGHALQSFQSAAHGGNQYQLYRVSGHGRKRACGRGGDPGSGAVYHGYQSQPFQDIFSPGQRPHQYAAEKKCYHQRQTSGGESMVYVRTGLMVSDADFDRRLDFLHASDAVRRRQGAFFRQKPGTPGVGSIRKSDL